MYIKRRNYVHGVGNFAFEPVIMKLQKLFYDAMNLNCKHAIHLCTKVTILLYMLCYTGYVGVYIHQYVGIYTCIYTYMYMYTCMYVDCVKKYMKPFVPVWGNSSEVGNPHFPRVLYTTCKSV